MLPDIVTMDIFDIEWYTCTLDCAQKKHVFFTVIFVKVRYDSILDLSDIT